MNQCIFLQLVNLFVYIFINYNINISFFINKYFNIEESMKFYKEIFFKITKEKGIKKEQIKKKLGIAGTTIWFWETGQRNPSEKNIRKLAKFLEVEVNRISDLKEKELDELKYNQITDQINTGNWLKQTLTSFDARKKTENELHLRIKQAFDELTESKMIINTLLNNIELIFYIKNYNNQYITANNKFIETMNLNSDYNVNGKTDKDLMTADNANANMREDELIIKTGKKITYEGYIPNTRKKKWGIIIKSPILTEDGDVFGLVATYFDITERKRTENNLKILDAVLNQSNNPVWIIEDSYELHKKNLFLSDSVEKLYGYSKDEFLADNMLLRKKCISNEDYRKILDIHRDGKYPKKYTLKVHTKYGDTKWIETTVFKALYENLECLIFVDSDITESKKESQLRELLEANINLMSDAIFISDIESDRILYANKMTEDLTNRTRDALLKTTRNEWLNKLVHKDDIDIVNNYKDPQINDVKCRITRKNKLIWVHGKRSIVEYAGKKCFLSIFNDITEKHNAEEKVKALDSSFNHSNIGAWIIDISTPKKKIVYISDSVEKVYGYSKDYFLNDPDFLFHDCIHPDDDKTLNKIKIGNKATQNIKFRILTKATELRWVSFTVSLTTYNDKQCLLCLSENITKEKEQEELLSLLETSVNQSNNVVWIIEGEFNNHKQNLYISDSAEKFYGCTKEEFLSSTTLPWKKSIPKTDFDEAVTTLKEKKYPIKYGYRIKTKDGKIKWIGSSVSEIHYKGKKCLIFIDNDKTEVKNQELTQIGRSLRIAQKMLKEDIEPDVISRVTSLKKEEFML